MPKSTSVFIYGSCVSRDTFEYFSSGQIKLGRYIARQSLLSAFPNFPSNLTTPVDIDLSTISSTFQRRMVDGDIHGSLPNELSVSTGAVDLLVWDLVDERKGVFELPNGAVLTDTDELSSSSFNKDWMKLSHHTDFGSPRYLFNFEASLDKFHDFLTANGLLEKSLFLDGPLASSRVTGETGDFRFDQWITTQHRELTPAYDRLRELVRQRGFPTMEIPSEVCTFSEFHRWGPAAYHYSSEYYRFVSAELENHLGVAGARTTQDASTIRLIDPFHMEESDDFLRVPVDRHMKELSVTIELNADTSNPRKAAILVFDFRKLSEGELLGANFTEYQGYGHYHYLGTTQTVGVNTIHVEVAETAFLDGVRIIPWDGARSLSIESLEISWTS